MGVLLWDFDGTLAFRSGMWHGCMLEILDQEDPEHGVDATVLRGLLRDGFPWHRPEVAHPELGDPDAWWMRIEALLAGAYEGAGVPPARASQLSRLFRARYADVNGWQLFPDTVGTLELLRDHGWRHVILSNHIPELPRLVADLGLSHLIERVLSSAALGYEKPNPEIFAIALRESRKPAEVWMIGDNPIADVAGALAVGIPAILVRADSPGDGHRTLDLDGISEIIGKSADNVGISGSALLQD